MVHLIDKSALVAEIKRLKENANKRGAIGKVSTIVLCNELLSFLDTLEVKDVDLIIHTVIAECCDWLAMNTNLSHDKIEGCRNLMLTVKDEQLKAQKGE